MKKDFWLNKWKLNQIGFHKNFVHPLLKKYESNLRLSRGDIVFLPLCGKSLDMIWLESRGYKVLGVEISKIAIEQFMKDNNRMFQVIERNGKKHYVTNDITLIQADLFEITKEDFFKVKAVYDRAALIALPDEMGRRYTKHLLNVLPKDIVYLLITLEMDIDNGPPFSQSEDRLKKLFSGFESYSLLRQKDIIEKELSFKESGCGFLFEKAHLIKN